MSYGVKYQGSVESLDGSIYTAKILEKDYSGPVREIVLADPAIVVHWGQQGEDIYKPLLESSAELHIYDRDRLIQSEVFDADEEQFRLQIEKSGAIYWLGKVFTDVFEDTLNLAADVTKIVGSDGLGQLESVPYERNGRGTVLQILLEILNDVGLDLRLFTAFNWFTPEMGSASNPIALLQLDRSILRNDEGEIISTKEALEIVLKRFGLQLYQSLSKWCAVQRELLTQNAYRYFEYDKNANLIGSGDYAPAVEAPVDVQYAIRLEGGQRTYRNAYKTATIVYKLLADSGPILKNGSFEEWDGEVPKDWSVVGFSGVGPTAEAKEGEFALRIPAHLVQGSLDEIPPGYIAQDSASVVGHLHRLRIELSLNFATRTDLDTPTPKKFYFRFKVGEYWLKAGPTLGRYVWVHQNNIVGNEHYISQFSGGFGAWIDYGFVTDPLPAGGGQIRFELYQPLEDQTYVTDSGEVRPYTDSLVVDALGIKVFLVGETENEVIGIQAQSLSVSPANKENRDVESFLIGDGPTSLSPGRLTVGADALTYDWQRGAYAPAQEPSGKSIDELLAETYLRAQKSPVEIHRATYIKRSSAGITLEPQHVLRIGDQRFALVSLERDLKQGTSTGEWVHVKIEDWDIFTGVSALTKEGAVSTLFADKKDVGSKTFASGFLGSGWKIAYDPKSGRYTLTIDNIVVRQKLSAYELLIQQVRATNGSLWVTSTGKVKRFVEVR